MNGMMESRAGLWPRDSLLINRDYRRLWLSSTASNFGDFVFETTLVLWIATDLAAGKPWAASATSLLLVAAAIPTLLLGPLAGVFADRWDPQRTRVIAATVSALVIGLLTLTAVPGFGFSLYPQLTCVLIAALLASVCAQFLAPASSLMLRDIVPVDQLPGAAGISQVSSSLNLLLGPSLAALVFAFAGPVWGLLLNTVSFVLSASLTAAIAPRSEWHNRTMRESTATVMKDLVAGLTLFRSNARLMLVAKCMTAMMITAGVINALDVYFVLDNLGGSQSAYGLLFSTQGAGMILGAVLAAWLAGRFQVFDLLWAALLGVGLSLLIYSQLSAVAPAFVVITLLGAFIAMFSVALSPIVLTNTPRAFVGRVSSVFGPLLNAGNMAGLLLGGLVYGVIPHDAQRQWFQFEIGALNGIFGVAALICIAVAIWTRKRVRRL